MKQIVPMDPNVLCVKIKLQNKVGALWITGQDDRVSGIRKVIAVSEIAAKRGIMPGDIVFTRGIQYPHVPVRLTVDEEVPYAGEHVVEIFDVSQIIGIYRDEDEADKMEGMTKAEADEK